MGPELRKRGSRPVLLAEQATSPDQAYAILRLRAAGTGTSLSAAADSIITAHHR